MIMIKPKIVGVILGKGLNDSMHFCLITDAVQVGFIYFKMT